MASLGILLNMVANMFFVCFFFFFVFVFFFTKLWSTHKDWAVLFVMTRNFAWNKFIKVYIAALHNPKIPMRHTTS